MTNPNIVPHVRWCEVHEKKGFTRKNAREVIKRSRRRSDTGSRAYPCTEFQGLWHTGHLPQATLYGLKTAREVYGDQPDAA